MRKIKVLESKKPRRGDVADYRLLVEFASLDWVASS